VTNATSLMTHGGRSLYCLAGHDVREAMDALRTGEAEGLVIARCRGFVGNDLSVLAQFSDLRALVVFDALDLDASFLSHVTSLRYLSLADVGGTVDLGGMSELRHLRLKIAKGISLPTSGLPGLEELAVWALAHKDLAFLSGFTALRSLEIIQAKKLESLAGVHVCKGLRDLVVAYCPALLDISDLSFLTLLETLDLQNVKGVSDFSSLSHLLGLEKLIIEKTSPLEDVEFLRGLRRLKHLVIRSAPIESGDLSPALGLPSLRHVYLDNKKEYGSAVMQLYDKAKQNAKARDS